MATLAELLARKNRPRSVRRRSGSATIWFGDDLVRHGPVQRGWCQVVSLSRLLRDTVCAVEQDRQKTLVGDEESLLIG